MCDFFFFNESLCSKKALSLITIYQVGLDIKTLLHYKSCLK